jgi:hypothetical protein
MNDRPNRAAAEGTTAKAAVAAEDDEQPDRTQFADEQ